MNNMKKIGSVLCIIASGLMFNKFLNIESKKSETVYMLPDHDVLISKADPEIKMNY